MAEPTKKSLHIERLIDATNPSGRKRVDSIKADICAWCGKSVAPFRTADGSYLSAFRDSLSRREYTISGFCQECQDKAFG